MGLGFCWIAATVNSYSLANEYAFEMVLDLNILIGICSSSLRLDKKKLRDYFSLIFAFG